ncbi:MAG: alpha/beta hydrolase [Planctomycetota bacterium]
MRVTLSRAVLALVPLLAWPADATAQRRGRSAGPPPKLEHLTYQEASFTSEALGGRKAAFGVYLPKELEAAGSNDDEPAKTYPLVIWLHGMFEDHNRFLSRGGAAVLDQMIGEGTVPPLVLVCANGDRSSFWTNAAVENAAYEDLVTKDLLAHVSATYPVRTDRAGRAITGVSMGGYGALKIALKDPSRFGVVAVHSAAVLPPDPDRLMEEFPWLQSRGSQLLSSVFGEPLDEDRYRAENVLALATGIDPEKLDGLRIYFDCGDQDRYGFHLTNENLHEVLEAREIAHQWRLVPGGGHSWGAGFTQEALTHSLRFVAQAFQTPRSEVGEDTAKKDAAKRGEDKPKAKAAGGH